MVKDLFFWGVYRPPQVDRLWGSGFRIKGLGFWVYSPPEVERIWNLWGSYYSVPKAIFYLLKGDRRVCL